MVDLGHKLRSMTSFSLIVEPVDLDVKLKETLLEKFRGALNEVDSKLEDKDASQMDLSNLEHQMNFLQDMFTCIQVFIPQDLFTRFNMAWQAIENKILQAKASLKSSIFNAQNLVIPMNSQLILSNIFVLRGFIWIDKVNKRQVVERALNETTESVNELKEYFMSQASKAIRSLHFETLKEYYERLKSLNKEGLKETEQLA